jgi:hypothetical protein
MNRYEIDCILYNCIKVLWDLRDDTTDLELADALLFQIQKLSLARELLIKA